MRNTVPMMIVMAAAAAVATPAAAQDLPALSFHARLAHAESETSELHVRAAELRAAGAELAALRPWTARPAVVRPPAAWVPNDPADSLWRAAREALSRGNAAAAAAMYRRIRSEPRFAASEYRDDAYYWEAFARNSVGSTAEKRTALAVLSQLRQRHPRYENMSEVSSLETRLNAELAASGDARAGARVAEQVSRGTAAQCPDQELQVAVIEALISMPVETALPTLTRVMNRRDECSAPLRERAIFIIARHKSPEAERILIEAIRSDPSAQVKQQAVMFLSNVNSERAVSVLADLIRNPSTDRQTLEHAVLALSRNSDPAAGRLLRDIASRTDVTRATREAAIMTLSRSDDPATTAFLREIFSSATDPDMKEMLLIWLARRPGQSQFVMDIAMNEREPMQVRKSALFWGSRHGQVPLGRLAELYGSVEDQEMKQHIIFTIAQRKEPEVVDTLIDFARRERNPQLRRDLIIFIGRTNDPRAARFLAEIIG